MPKVRCSAGWCYTRRRVKLSDAAAYNGKWYHSHCAEYLMEADRKKKEKKKEKSGAFA